LESIQKNNRDLPSEIEKKLGSLITITLMTGSCLCVYITRSKCAYCISRV